jgi:hypothetical protein
MLWTYERPASLHPGIVDNMGAASFCHPAIKNDSSAIWRSEKAIVVWKSRALIEADRRNRQKKAGSESLPSQLSGFYILRQLSTHCGSSGDDGGENKPDAHRTSSMKVPHNNHHSTGMVESIHTGNCCIRNPDSHNSRPEIQPQFPQFQPKSERQNAAWERKPIHLPSMQSKEAFSYIFPSIFHYQ